MYLKELNDYTSYVSYQDGRSAALTNANTIFRDISKANLEIPKESYILDIGCRAGAFTVKGFLELGYINSYGIDIGKSAESYWNNYSFKEHLKCADIHDGNPFPYIWDFITISHTLEHLYDPFKVIKLIHECMNINGIIHSIVPIESSIEDFQKHKPHMVMFDNHEEHKQFYNSNNFKVFFDFLDKPQTPASVLFAKKI